MRPPSIRSATPVTWLGAPLLLIAALCACGPIEVSASTELSAADVAAEAERALADKVSANPNVDCADGLRAQAGERTSCTMTLPGDHRRYEVDVSVSQIDGSQYSLNVRSDDYRAESGTGTIFADEVARRARSQLRNEYGADIRVSCPNDLAGVADKTTRCELRDGNATYDVTARVTDVAGQTYELDFAVDADRAGDVRH